MTDENTDPMDVEEIETLDVLESDLVTALIDESSPGPNLMAFAITDEGRDHRMLELIEKDADVTLGPIPVEFLIEKDQLKVSEELRVATTAGDINAEIQVV